MEKYTFESWLNNEIDESTLASWSMGLDPLKGQIEESDFRKIRATQKETYEIAVEITFKSMVREFKQNLEQSPYPNKMYSNLVSYIQSILDKDQKITKSVLSGNTSYIKITGKEHLHILKNAKEFNLNETIISLYALNDHQRIMSHLKFKYYLDENHSQFFKTDNIESLNLECIDQVVNLDFLNNLLEDLLARDINKNYLIKTNKQITFKSKDALFAFILRLDEKGHLKISLIDHRDEIGIFFLNHFNKDSTATDPCQNLRKGAAIARKTRDFFKSIE
ncbi:MAG: hypothetical protein JXQ96_13660 [Cyclobacteriaceae bacterium]